MEIRSYPDDTPQEYAERISRALEAKEYVNQRRLAKSHGTMNISSRFHFLLEDLKIAEKEYTKAYDRFVTYVQNNEHL